MVKSLSQVRSSIFLLKLSSTNLNQVSSSDFIDLTE